jgi:putative ABC transport system permease protein
LKDKDWMPEEEARMNPLRLALRSILGIPFRSVLVVICVALVAGSGAWSVFVVSGAQAGLRLGVAEMQHAGVDLVVVPRAGGGAGTSAANIDLPGLLDRLRAVPGVESASPQQSLASLPDCGFCMGYELFIVAFDPGTDFTLRQQLTVPTAGDLGMGEAYAGSLIPIPAGQEHLDLAGFPLELAGRLQPGNTSQDYSLYISFDTARELLRQAGSSGRGGMDLSEGSIPVILVSVVGEQAGRVSQRILKSIPGVTVYDQTVFFQAGRTQLGGILRSIPVVLGTIWLMAFLFIAMTFMIAVNERRREIGLLRALGSTRRSALRLLLVQGFLLALVGNATGLVPGLLAGTVFRESVTRLTGLPMAAVSPAGMLAMVLGSLALTLAGVSLAVLIPARRINRLELAAVLSR